MKKLACAMLLVGVITVALVSGCGDRVLTLNLDLLSFMDTTIVTDTYGDFPPIPPGIDFVEIDSEVQEINLTEGLADIVDPRSTSLHVTAEFVNETGTADVEFILFISDALSDPFDTEPYVHETIHLEPASTNTLNVSALGDERLGALLTGETIRVALRRRFNTTESSENLLGVQTLIRFTATVVAQRHINP